MHKQCYHLWFVISITLGMICVFPMMAKAELTDGLVSAWLFEETGGQEARDSIGLNHGRIQGGVKRVDGKIGRALEFNGVDGFVEIPDNKTLHLPSALTVAAWMKGTESNVKNNMAICWKGDKIAFGAFYSWRVATRTPTGMTWGRCSVAAGPEGYFHTFGVVKPDTWNHVALVADGTVLKAYVNGEDITEKSTETGMRVAGPYNVYEGRPVEIGAGRGFDGTDNKGYFSGIIDEVLIYDRALSQEELRELTAGASIAKALGVEPVTKLPITWGAIKQ